MNLKYIALAALLAAGSANAAIDVGSSGNGDLFFNIWDDNGSYTRDLNVTINGLDTAIAAAGNLDLMWSADTTLTSFLAGTVGGARAGTLQWNIVALDGSGARRMPTTLDGAYAAINSTDVRNTIGSAAQFAADVNSYLDPNVSGADSAAFLSSDLPYAGRAGFGYTAGGLSFDTTGILANNSYASGLEFLQVKANASGTTTVAPLYYADGTSAVKAWVDGGNKLHLAAAAPVPEADTYAFMALGMGLVGLLARRRKAA